MPPWRGGGFRDAQAALRWLEADFESKDIRPALGWAGLEFARDVDESIKRMYQAGKIIEVNQTPWLKSHSGMQEPRGELGEILRQKSYHDAIVEPMLKTTGFGRYPRKGG